MRENRLDVTRTDLDPHVDTARLVLRTAIKGTKALAAFADALQICPLVGAALYEVAGDGSGDE